MVSFSIYVAIGVLGLEVLNKLKVIGYVYVPPVICALIIPELVVLTSQIAAPVDTVKF